MTELDLTLLEPILRKYAVEGRPGLLPALHAAQDIYGYLPEAVSAEIGKALGVPLADVFGVIEFYTLFYNHPVGKAVLHVCNDAACAMAGADSVYKTFLAELSSHPGQDNYTVERAPCLGLCEHAPALFVKDGTATRADLLTYADLVAGRGSRPQTRLGGDLRLLTANIGKNRPTSYSEYEQEGGYTALKRALGMAPGDVIAEVKASGLLGRGGAAFPTGVKWESAAREAEPIKYVICNADEAEPGTFKDRIMMEEDPHRILEGLIIAAYAIGAHKGYVYIRGEYYYPWQVMNLAVEEAEAMGLLGKNILNSGFDFDVELRRGAGAYVCGEETALFESIEGKRGFPRIKPPFPTTSGLFGKPTVINNVETLCNIPLILRYGVNAYRKIGTEKSPGPKLFCVSGDVAKPGLYEVPFGVTLRHLVMELAGGLRPERSLQAILMGGAAGAFASPDQLDTPLTFEDLRAAGLPLGSGVVTVLDNTRDLREILLRLGHFFAEESCGKCYPCQLGTQRQMEVLERIAAGKPLSGDIERLMDVGWTMTDASLCGLGQTAASAVMSAIRKFPHLFESIESQR